MARAKLIDYLQAGYPLIHYCTTEYERAEEVVRDALIACPGGNPSDAFAVWREGKGLRLGTVESGVKSGVQPQATDVLSSIQYVENSETPIFAVFHNLREYIKSTPVFQVLIDAAENCRYTGSTIILLGPRCEVPLELKSLLCEVDHPLPNVDEIYERYTAFVMNYLDKIRDEDGTPWLDQTEDHDGLRILNEIQRDILRQAARTAVGLDAIGAENAIALSVASQAAIDLEVIRDQKEAEVRRSDVLEFVSGTETMDEVGGMDILKDWLRRRRSVFSDEARAYGLPYPKGILLAGPGGTGKSLCAKAVSQFLGLPLLRMDIGRIFRALVGESEAATRMALNVAEAVSPCVLWIDEIDKGLAGGSTQSSNLDSGVTARVVGTILTWRAETKAPVVMVATANEVASLPPMVYRKGRFDEVWATDLPNIAEREEIFKIHIAKRNRDPEEFDVKQLASKTFGFVGSEIESSIEDAMFIAFDDGGRELETEDILQAIEDTTPQFTDDKSPELQRLREFIGKVARPVSSGDKKIRQKKSGNKKPERVLRAQQKG